MNRSVTDGRALTIGQRGESARRGDRQCCGVLDGVHWTKAQAGFSAGGVVISDSSRTADPRAAGGGAAALPLVSIKPTTAATAEVGGALGNRQRDQLAAQRLR
jgi:hypothetical protein